MLWILGLMVYAVGAMLVFCAFLAVLLWTIFVWSVRVLLMVLAAVIAAIRGKSESDAQNRSQSRYSDRR